MQASGALPDTTFVAVAAYNESRTIRQVLADLSREWPHVVVVDDGSSDDTAELARRGGATVLRHLVNRGQGAALQTGLAWALAAGARYVVTCDADGQHRADDIHRLLAPLAAGRAEICLGSRFLEGAAEVPPARRLLLRCAVAFTRVTSGVRVTDAHNGLRAFTRRAAARINLRLDRMAHASEIIDQIAGLGLPFTEVPVRVRYTDYSRAKGQRPTAAFRVALDYLLGRLLG